MYIYTISSNRLHGKVILYEYDDPTQETHFDTNPDNKTYPENITVNAKIQMKGDIHITIWNDTQESNETKRIKWVVGIKGSNVKFVPMMNRLFNRKVTGSRWIQMQDIGKMIS